MRKFFTILWLVWAGLWFIVVFLLIYIPLLFLFISPKTYRYAHYLRRFWGTTCCYLGFIIPKVTFESTLPKNQQFVFCANHISYIDIVCCGSLLPGFNFFMGKAELAEIPLFGIWFRTLDIAVKRSSIKGSYRAYVEAGEQMDRLGANLIIYPEGRIPQDAPNIKFPFKAGAFRLAIEKQVPIVPITLPDNLARFDLDNFKGSPGKMRMFVHTPIETKGLSLEDIPALQKKVYDVISSQLKSVGVL